MKVVKRVLLLDDKVRHTNRFDRSKPGKVESLLESYGQSLKENGFEAKAPPALDGRRFPLQTHALPKVTRIVRGWIDEFCPDGIVLDLDWWNDEVYGERLWNELHSQGLQFPRQCVVFVSNNVTLEVLASVAERCSLDPRQVNRKDTPGFAATTVWLSEHL